MILIVIPRKNINPLVDLTKDFAAVQGSLPIEFYQFGKLPVSRVAPKYFASRGYILLYCINQATTNTGVVPICFYRRALLLLVSVPRLKLLATSHNLILIRPTVIKKTRH